MHEILGFIRMKIIKSSKYSTASFNSLCLKIMGHSVTLWTDKQNEECLSDYTESSWSLEKEMSVKFPNYESTELFESYIYDSKPIL